MIAKCLSAKLLNDDILSQSSSSENCSAIVITIKFIYFMQINYFAFRVQSSSANLVKIINSSYFMSLRKYNGVQKQLYMFQHVPPSTHPWGGERYMLKIFAYTSPKIYKKF